MADRPATTSSKKQPGHKRRVAGWTLLVIGVLITGVWGASGWWIFGYDAPTWTLFSANGRLGILAWSPPRTKAAGWECTENSPPFSYWSWMILDHENATDPNSMTRVNLLIAGYEHNVLPTTTNLHIFKLIPWPFALASLLGGGWLVWSGRRAKRRAMTGVCPKCGYDLRGLTESASCPECGPASSARRAESQ